MMMLTPWIWLLLLGLPRPTPCRSQRSEPVFASVTSVLLPPDYENNPTQLNYGMAVTDVDGDGDLEVVVAGYNGPNLVLKYDRNKKRLVNIAVDDRSSPYYALRDRQGNAIGVAACDIDGDGREELYFLNTNNAFSGRATYTDKLFKFRNGRFEDLLSDDINEHRDVANRMAGRSVACLDRKGTGRYAIYIANYASGNVGAHALLEMDEAASDPARGVIALSNVAEEAGVNKFTGGRGVVVGPILSQTRSDVFCDNEYGPNFLFRNNGDGTFTDVASTAGVEDPMQHGRGVALADFNRDGKTDIVYGNWNGPHRLFLQLSTHRKQRFKDISTQKFSMPSPVRTVIAADFDNDNELEVFFNNIAYRGASANRLFRVARRDHADPLIEELNVGEAAEPDGRGTGATVTDFDGDGQLDLLVSHGESAAQPISVYRVSQGSSNRWLRVIPRTQFGAFARGAKVVTYTKRSGSHTRIIDGGSGYLCQMEPVAHFGLGKDVATSVEVFWPDGRSVARPLELSEMNSVLEIPYPVEEDEGTPATEIECGNGFVVNENGRCKDQDECTEFPSVCPRDRPLCINTYGGFKCRATKRCGQGFEPNDEGTACVAQVAYFEGNRSSAGGIRALLSHFSMTLLAFFTLTLLA
ncbi:cartilage acidic protein 1 isoform X1 [Anguilla anguilla]|uniref:cartilage acidic protein 1 isoform X1 n=1 Tax=Anguilla anguilla TaxID=7936 RepID=UPI0015AC892A|nr:cartilage acidic protein 1 isoform X1 [Anguilla anguilla]XP_035255554.1 cartilage acidic protein 1 isoform X1 [Anguilla anguilla]XP_035255555.1 cartilage acidic protein 1 isoform X1 [Anguilla anguilla]